MNNAQEARRLLRAHRYGALSTLSKKFPGYPYGSITPYLVDHDGDLLILISELAEHTKNIRDNPHVSLITHDQRDPNIQTQGRVSVLGDAVQAPDQEAVARRFLRLFPETRRFYELPGFSFFRIHPNAIRFIGGFGHIHWVNMENYVVPDAAAFGQQEAALLTEVNARYQGVMRQLLQQRHGIEATEVEAVGLDCDGLDARAGEHVWRLDLADTIAEPAEFIEAFSRL